MSKTKKKPAVVPSEKDPNKLTVEARPGDTEEAAVTRVALTPTLQAAVTLRAYNNTMGDLCIPVLADELAEQCRNVNSGDLSRAESMLTAQAHTLDAIFGSLARRAALNMGEYLDAAEAYMRLALKAQAQCRATLETLAEIKNPRPVAFVKQANIAHGPQQVNNGGPADAPARGESAIAQNELLEGVTHEQGQRLELGTAAVAGAAHPAMATLGAVHRADDGRR